MAARGTIHQDPELRKGSLNGKVAISGAGLISVIAAAICRVAWKKPECKHSI
jgi:hypothetical protein